jgi:hypothetical protein
MAVYRMLLWIRLFGRETAWSLRKIKNADAVLMHHAPL